MPIKVEDETTIAENLIRGPFNSAIVCAGEYVGLEEIEDGIWDVYFGPLTLGRLHERHMLIEDEYGRLKRK